MRYLFIALLLTYPLYGKCQCNIDSSIRMFRIVYKDTCSYDPPKDYYIPTYSGWKYSLPIKNDTMVTYNHFWYLLQECRKSSDHYIDMALKAKDYNKKRDYYEKALYYSGAAAVLFDLTLGPQERKTREDIVFHFK